MKQYIWVAYSRRQPFLPVAVADTMDEIAQLTGATKSGVRSAWWYYTTGKRKFSRFHKVRV